MSAVCCWNSKPISGIVGESYVFTLNGVRLKVLHEMVLSFAEQVEGRDPHSIGEIWQNFWGALNPNGQVSDSALTRMR